MKKQALANRQINVHLFSFFEFTMEDVI